MIVRLAFFHFRSSRALIRIMRREFVRVAHEIDVTIPNQIKKTQKDINNALETRVYKDIIELIKEFRKVEDLIDDIFKNEMIISYEVQKREHKSEKALYDSAYKIFNKLPNELQESLKRSHSYLTSCSRRISWLIKRIRKRSRDLYFERDRLATYNFNLSAKEAAFSNIKRKFIEEVEDSDKEKREEKKVINIIKVINESSEKLKKLLDKKQLTQKEQKHKELLIKRLSFQIKNVEKETKKLDEIIKEEVDVIDKIVYQLTRFKLLIDKDLKEGKGGLFGEHSVANILNYIKIQGFDEELWNKLDNERKGISRQAKTKERRKKMMGRFLRRRQMKKKDKSF